MHHKRKPCWNIIINRCTINKKKKKKTTNTFAKPNMAQCEHKNRVKTVFIQWNISIQIHLYRSEWMHHMKILIDSGFRVQLIKHCLSIADRDDFVVSNEICKWIYFVCVCVTAFCLFVLSIWNNRKDEIQNVKSYRLFLTIAIVLPKGFRAKSFRGSPKFGTQNLMRNMLNLKLKSRFFAIHSKIK